jgi:hypothetical protein
MDTDKTNPAEILLFNGARAAAQAACLLQTVWNRPEPATAEECAALLRAARLLHCVAEELDCRRRGTAGSCQRLD